MEAVLIYEYVYCSRSGITKKHNVETLKGVKGKQKRKRSSQMIQCPTKIGFKVVKGTTRFFVLTLVAEHNQE